MKNIYLCLLIALCTLLSGKVFSNHDLLGVTCVNSRIVEIQFIFNQPKYAPGDTAFFKSYLFLKNKKASSEKRIVNLKLIDGAGHQVLYNRLLFTKGSCISQIIIPENITPAVYTIVGYLDDVKVDNPDGNLLYESDFIVAGEKEFNSSSSYKTSVQDYKLTPLNINLTFDKSQYKTRDLVKASLSIKDLNNNPVKLNLTITVLQDDLFKRKATSDTSHAVNNANIGNVQNVQSHNNENIEAEKYYPCYFKGRVVFENAKAVADSTLVTFYLNKEDFIYGLYTKNNGEFEFPLFKNFGDDEIFYVVSYQGKSQTEAKIILDNSQFENKVREVEKLSSNDAYGNYAMIKKAILKSYTYYSVKERNVNSLNKNDEIESDYVVDMDKFETFPSMAEVLGNIVQAVKYFKTKDKESVRVFLKSNGYYGKEDPVFIIDGIMTDNTDYFLSLDPALVSKIRLLRSQATLNRYGSLGKNGIVAVETKILNNNITMPRTERSLFITGVNTSMEFKTHMDWKSLIPDIRAALYWNPQVITQADKDLPITFNTSDATGKFIIRIEGFTEEELPVFFETSFQVVYTRE